MYVVDHEGHAITVMVERANQQKYPNGFDVSIVIKQDGEVVARQVRVIEFDSPTASTVAREQGLELARHWVDTGRWD